MRKRLRPSSSTRAALESEEFRSGFFERKVTTYANMIRVQLEQNNLGGAFNYNERARSRAFLDILGSKVQMGQRSALIEERKRSYGKGSINTKRDYPPKHDKADDEESSDESLSRSGLAAAEKAYTAFLAKVRKENREQAALMNVEPLTVKQVQDLLDPGVTMLEYFVTQDAVLTWIVEKDKVESVTTPLRRGQLRSRVGSFREAIQQFEEKDKFKQQSEELYKTLIQAALPHVKGNELIIVPHDVLHYLPFQALLSPQGKYLIEDYRLIIFPAPVDAVHPGEAKSQRRVDFGSGPRRKTPDLR